MVHPTQKFFRKGYHQNVNLMHDSGSIVNGLTMFESWISDEKCLEIIYSDEKTDRYDIEEDVKMILNKYKLGRIR